jgi:hypothetical protein
VNKINFVVPAFGQATGNPAKFRNWLMKGGIFNVKGISRAAVAIFVFTVPMRYTP